MKKILVLFIVGVMVMCAAINVFAADNRSEVREEIVDVLFRYKDAYNLRDMVAVRALYLADAQVESFPCQSTEKVPFNEFSASLTRCISYWVDGGFKLRLFRITEFKLDGNECRIRVSWDYRDNSGRGKFTPSFVFIKKDGKWMIAEETYGRRKE